MSRDEEVIYLFLLKNNKILNAKYRNSHPRTNLFQNDIWILKGRAHHRRHHRTHLSSSASGDVSVQECTLLRTPYSSSSAGTHHVLTLYISCISVRIFLVFICSQLPNHVPSSSHDILLLIVFLFPSIFILVFFAD